MNLKTDILIVGGGPSGCVAALTAAKYKYRSILIERKKFPRDKICGDGLLVNELSEIFRKIDIDFEDFLSNEKVEIHESFPLCDSHHNSFSVKNRYAIVKRYNFDNWLWNLIENNSTENVKFENVEIHKIERVNNVYCVYGSGNSEEYIIQTKFIIASDGYSSSVRRFFFKNLTFNCRVASRYYYKTNTPAGIATKICFEDKVIPGYFWVFKINKNCYNTGVYIAENSKENIYEVHNFFMKKYFNHEIPKDEFCTWPIPNNFNFTNLAKENIVLTGDAAGLCDKMFGHGIDHAAASGFIAIDAITDFINSTAESNLNEVYSHKMHQHFGNTLYRSYCIYESLKNVKNNFLNSLLAALSGQDK